ncbi:hypothetical protein [Modestobacter sp. NPDC049651]|uniref:hypothetical protein n=1 Tax=unclassified Modestobacter TaxID=2643866 RepID=UPI0033FDA4BA
MTAPGPAASRFEHELRSAPHDLDGPELLPARMARAAALALGVDGAGLSLHDPGGLRTPLGASDPLAALAERLQFTFGAGPALRAHDDGVSIAFDEADIRRNWAELHRSLMADTPFRAVLSVPLLPPLGPVVVLDLYLRLPERMTRLDRAEVEDVVICLTRLLVEVMSAPASPEGGATWWSGPDAQSRTRVWQAMGMAAVLLRIDPADALEVLKAHAFSTDRVVDDVADDVIAGRLTAEELGWDGATG